MFLSPVGHDVAGQIVTLIRRHLGSSFFQYDASLVRDGCFYAGLCLARDSGTEEDIRTCVQALEEMRWAFSKSEERIATLKWAWENRRVDEEERLWNEGLGRPGSDTGGTGATAGGSEGGYGGGDMYAKGLGGMSTVAPEIMRSGSGGVAGGSGNSGHGRPPRLNLMEPQPPVDAGPLTALSDGSWHTPSSSSEMPNSHQGSPSSDPPLLLAGQDKASNGPAGTLGAMQYYDPHMTFDMGTFGADGGASHFTGEPAPFFSSGLGHHAHAGHAMPSHGMAVPHGMSGPIGMAGHGMQASSAPGSTTLPPFGAQHYDAYYPHSNSSHR